MNRLMNSRSVGVVVAGLLWTVVATASASAQTVSGEAFGAYVATSTVSQGKTSLATLPSVAPGDGAMASAESEALSVPNALESELLTSVATGAVGSDGVSAQSVATVADVNILNGMITATRVIGVASSYYDGATAASNATGSTFEDLRVNGVAVTVGDAAIAPNTRIALPSAGYVVLNEQTYTGDGVSSSGVSLNMIHVVLQDAATGATTGEIVVGGASSSVAR